MVSQYVLPLFIVLVTVTSINSGAEATLTNKISPRFGRQMGFGNTAGMASSHSQSSAGSSSMGGGVAFPPIGAYGYPQYYGAGVAPGYGVGGGMAAAQSQSQSQAQAIGGGAGLGYGRR